MCLYLLLIKLTIKYLMSCVGYMPRELPVTCLSVEPRFDPALLAMGGNHKSNVPKSYNGHQSPARGQGNAVRSTAAMGYLPVASSRRPLTEVNSIGKKIIK